MKKIYFIRHAKSQKDPNLSDFDRVINKRGKNDISFMAKKLKDRKIQPEIIISSAAKRAAQSARIIGKIVKIDKISYTKKLYNASCEEIFKFIKNIDENLSQICIISHNPAITEICELLSDSIIDSIPTSGIFCIKFDETKFSEINAHCGKVEFFDYPKLYKEKK